MDWQVIIAIVNGICGAVAAVLTVRNQWIQGKVLTRKAELANVNEGANDKDRIRDLTRLAREGGCDPLIGQARESDQIIQVLMRQTRNNLSWWGQQAWGNRKTMW